MFDKTYEDRLASWRDFRDSLEEHSDPLQAVISKYNEAPHVNIYFTDPWDQTTWPTPWQLIDENQYCEFNRVLGMCYSLQLTDRFKGSSFEIHISTDNALTQVYLLFINNNVLGWDETKYVHKDTLPKDLVSQKVYDMPPLQ
jgi:hypothetical protein